MGLPILMKLGLFCVFIRNKPTEKSIAFAPRTEILSVKVDDYQVRKSIKLILLSYFIKSVDS